MKFHLNSFNGCQLTERTRNSIANDQREITPKISKAELWFFWMTHRLIVLYNCMKFSVMFHFMFVHYTFSSVLVAEWPPFGK